MYGRVPILRVVLAAYNAMARLSGLACAPRLEFVRSLGGIGGLYLDGLILVGSEDADAIARKIWSSNTQYVNDLVEVITRNRVFMKPSAFEFLRIAVLGRIVAHELGHAMREQLGSWTPFADEEAAADFLAGEFDGLRGRNRDLGALIFFEIGCRGPFCTHPSPSGRAHAYLDGYEQAQIIKDARDSY